MLDRDVMKSLSIAPLQSILKPSIHNRQTFVDFLQHAIAFTIDDLWPCMIPIAGIWRSGLAVATSVGTVLGHMQMWRRHPMLIGDHTALPTRSVYYWASDWCDLLRQPSFEGINCMRSLLRTLYVICVAASFSFSYSRFNGCGPAVN